jgi:hypothetical protein
LVAQCIDLGAILLAGGRDGQRYQVAQRIDSRMHLRAVAPFVAIVPGTRPPFAAALQCSAVQDDSAGLALAALGRADDGAHVADHRLKAARFKPTAKLLVNHRPRRQIIGQLGAMRHLPGPAIEGR